MAYLAVLFGIGVEDALLPSGGAGESSSCTVRIRTPGILGCMFELYEDEQALCWPGLLWPIAPTHDVA
jgi:hypothetical protein